jgi:uncharacterized protein (DUF1778 family)
MPQIKTQKIDVRVAPTVKVFLQIAADAAHQSVSDFVRDSAIRRAEETLPDRRRFSLDDAQWEAFQAILNAPTRTIPRLAKLMQEPSIFERE